MKILHCCLAAFYIDDYAYQENIFPKMHKLQGHDVAILASTETYLENNTLGYINSASYFTKDGISITRVPYVKWVPHFIARKIRIYCGISKILKDFNPDIIFIHDCQFMSIIEIISYIKKYKNVTVYVDGHTDFINSARSWVSKNILHRIIYRWCAKKIEPFTAKFYGVLPLRVDFFRTVYGIAAEKIELLVMGLDDSAIDFGRREEIRTSIRMSLQLEENDFVIITGGKIDHAKNIHNLMRAVDELNDKNIKLIVFGAPNNLIKNEIESLAKSKCIRYIGWIPSEDCYNYFMAADLAFFPGTHSVLWEQAVGMGLPCIFKRWIGIQHIDLGGNCLFTDTDDLDEIKEKIMLLSFDSGLLSSMTYIAREKGIPFFSYYEIAKRAIRQ